MRRILAAVYAVTLVIVASLLFSNLPCTFSSSTQPPVDTSTYRSATIGGPIRFDPTRAYDVAGGEILQNVYETLIFFSDKPFAPEANAEITDEYVADLDNFVPVLATKVPSIADGDISLDGKNWTFTINTNAVFQRWFNRWGRYEPERNITVEDVVYSFQRQMVYDSPYGRAWMWMTPAFGSGSWSSTYGGPFSTYDNGTFKNPEDEITAGNMIQSWVYPGPGANQVTFHFQEPEPENMVKQNFAGTWGSILNKDWVIEHGGWDGQFTPGWTNDYHWKPTKTRSELDVWKDPAIYGEKGSQYSSNAPDIPDACGTGPYIFTSWDPGNNTWRIDKFTGYWRGWTQAGDKAGNYLSTVIVQGIASWPTRKPLFLEGEFDVAVIPRANMWELLNQSDLSGHTPISGIRLYWNIPTLQNEALLFQFDVSPDSPYVPKNGTNPAPNLFADVHMRRAFAYALNLTQYSEDYLHYRGESIEPRASWWLRGVKPDYENKTLTPHDTNLTIVEEELKAAGVWEQGFEVKFVDVIGDITPELMAENIIIRFLANMNPKFNVSYVGIYTSDYVDYYYNKSLPLFFWGSIADFAEPADLAGTYMHSEEFLASLQNYNDTRVDYLVDLGLSQADGPERNATYQELQYIYWRDVPSLPILQDVSRWWSRDWVRGWYYNPLYSGLYYYDLYKEGLSTPNGSGGQVVDYSVPIIAFGTIVATIVVGSAIYVRHVKKESPPKKEEPNQEGIRDS